MPQRVFLTGASGFVGSGVLAELVRGGYAVTALVNRKNPTETGGDVRVIRIDLFDATALAEAMAGCDAVIHLIGIIKEIPARQITFDRMHVQATRCVLEAAKQAKVTRFIHMSALGVSPDAQSDYGRTKWQAEELVCGNGLQWTIFRPSMIHGPGGEFMRMEAKWARRKSPPFLFMPYFAPGILGLGDGGHIQPVFVDDVARAFVSAIANPKSIGHTYDLSGADRLTWPQMHKIASRVIVGKERFTLAIPAWYARMLAAVFPRSMLPFNRDQVIMSLEDNSSNSTDFQQDFGWRPVGFAKALTGYAEAL